MGITLQITQPVALSGAFTASGNVLAPTPAVQHEPSALVASGAVPAPVPTVLHEPSALVASGVLSTMAPQADVKTWRAAERQATTGMPTAK